MATLATLDDVEAVLLRELSGPEAADAARLLVIVSAMAREVSPQIDAAIAGGRKAAGVVASICASSVARFMRNPRGVRQEATGPFSVTYTTPGGGSVGFTADEVAGLRPRLARAPGTIRLGSWC